MEFEAFGHDFGLFNPKLLVFPGTVDAQPHVTEDYPMKFLSCKEAGKDCNYIARGNTEDEVLKKAFEHSKNVHGMKDSEFTNEMREQIRSLVHDDKKTKVA